MEKKYETERDRTEDMEQNTSQQLKLLVLKQDQEIKELKELIADLTSALRMSKDELGLKQSQISSIFDDNMMEWVKKMYPLTSNSQWGEDILLYKFLHGIEHGFYIDIGCHHHYSDSVTLFFYLRGWRGINIDAQSEIMTEYSAKRPHDINLCATLSDCDGIDATLYLRGGLTTLNLENATRLEIGTFQERQITTSTFQTLVSSLSLPDVIHFLKNDVEMHEKQVLLGIDLCKYRPWVIAIESVLPNTSISCSDQWEYILDENDYIFFCEHAVNRFYLAKEKEEELVANFISKPLLPFLRQAERTRIQTIHDLGKKNHDSKDYPLKQL